MEGGGEGREKKTLREGDSERESLGEIEKKREREGERRGHETRTSRWKVGGGGRERAHTRRKRGKSHAHEPRSRPGWQASYMVLTQSHYKCELKETLFKRCADLNINV